MAFFIFSASFCAFSAGKLVVSDPKDRTTTQNTRLFVSGTAVYGRPLKVNDVNVVVEPDGAFEAAALLRPGKNLVLVESGSNAAQKESYRARILRIVTFDDIENYSAGKPHWSKRQVVNLATLGIIEGYPDNTFLPEQAITRGELATWLARAKGLKVFAPKADVFFDVPKEHWRAPYIKAVTDLGFMKEERKNKFGIDDTITRSDAVETFVKAFGLRAVTGKRPPFDDVPETAAYFPSIKAAYDNGMIIGYPGKKRMFGPQINMKRSEASLLIASLPVIRPRLSDMYDFERGYTAQQLCRIGTRPIIKSAEVYPSTVASDGKSAIRITATITDEQGQEDISLVWADITAIMGPNDAKMSKNEKGVYELDVNVTSESTKGEKLITVKALDKTGLETDRSVKFNVIGAKQ